MILPIVAYGDPVLKKKAKPITKEYPKLPELIDNMFETMYGANGLGLAAPQIGLSIRMFLVDTSPFANDKEFTEEEQAVFKDFKKVFINAEILESTGEEWVFNEGCLSIPGITEDVFRESTITIKYQDENFKEYTETYDGIIARVIQHEYDHIEGILFTDKLSSLKKRILKGRLANISKGKCDADYRMRFPSVSKKR
ncbi:peptide deformylase [Dokdonia pacifica]|uniref:Peptide deformylase n=1 Tax=Dokdonia pacifica TaxID=1627892 RepID=A0A238YIY5_9FLAO|nr:peptide deformylase [Dokdonia pacifica]GGG11987.1 peptide deformylase [Dokdonia pacifica]SNR71135.1 peptide deformylase [Dokdonia pacifica]